MTMRSFDFNGREGQLMLPPPGPGDLEGGACRAASNACQTTVLGAVIGSGPRQIVDSFGLADRPRPYAAGGSGFGLAAEAETADPGSRLAIRPLKPLSGSKLN
jgi:hypothetical protein